MQYDPFLKMPEVEYMFRTKRGSTYAHLPGSQTIRNRSGLNHSDVSTGLQPKSTKTLYMDTRAVNAVGSFLQDPSFGSTLIPEFGKDGKSTGHALVSATDDFYRPASKYGSEVSIKKGQTLTRVPFALQPKEGMHPVEILGSSDSPKGSKAKNIHFGNVITEVMPQTKSGISALPKAAGKAGIAASLMGAAASAKAGNFGNAFDQALDLFVLPFAESRELNTNENEELEKRRTMPPTIDPLQQGGVSKFAKGGAILMPKSYSEGNWKLI